MENRTSPVSPRRPLMPLLLVGLVVLVALLAILFWPKREAPPSVAIAEGPRTEDTTGVGRRGGAAAPRARDETRRDLQREEVESASESPAEEPAALPSTDCPELGPYLDLDVVDAVSGRHLDQLEIRLVPRYFAAARLGTPQAGPPGSGIARSLRSPLRVRACFETAQRDRTARVEFDDLVTRQWVPLPETFVTDRGFALYARSAAHAWARVDIDLRQPARQRVALSRAGSLRIQIDNCQPDGWRALEMPAILRVSGPGHPEPWLERPLPDSTASFAATVEGLPVGEGYEATVELGHRWRVRERTQLGRADFAIRAGEQSDVRMRLDDPPAPAGPAALRVELRLADFPDRADAVLRLFRPDYVQGAATAVIPLTDMKPLAGTNGRWTFELELPAGRYQAKLWPLLSSWTIDLPPEGTEAILDASRLARVEVQVRRRAGGEPLAVDGLFYRRTESLPDMAHHAGETRSPKPDASPGRFVLHTTPGELNLRAEWEPDNGDPDWSGETTIDVTPGTQTVDVLVRPQTRVAIRFTVDGTKLPIASAGLPRIQLRALAGPGQVRLNGMAVGGWLAVSHPNTYRIEMHFPEGSPFHYDGPPIDVTARSEQITAIEIPLQQH